MKELKSHELNFYGKYIINPEKARQNRLMLMYSIPAFLLVTGLIIAVVSMMNEQTALQEEIEYQQQIMDDAGLLEEYGLALSVSDTLAVLDAEVAGMELFWHIKDSYPVIGMDDIYTILDSTLPGMRVVAVSFEPKQGKVVVTVETEDVTDIPLYINELKGTGLFKSVDYGGYTGGENKDANTGITTVIYSVYINMTVNTPETDFDFNEYLESRANELGENEGDGENMDININIDIGE